LHGQATARLGEFVCSPKLFSINSHALLKEGDIQQKQNNEKNAEEEEKEGEKEK